MISLGKPMWRRLPHVDHPCAVQHVVFRLYDSLPRTVIEDLKRQRPSERIEGADATLDAGLGSRALAQPAVAAEMAGALRSFDGRRYQLKAWCIMPTHVHVLIESAEGWPLPVVVHGWKSFTARRINGAMGREGRFWAPNYFDRYMRNDEQFMTTLAYIEGNPVKAGLCPTPADWPWSSAGG